MIKFLSFADGISLLNASFGFLAILIISSDIILSYDMRIRISFSFILLALLADGLDGIIARKTHTGELGEYLEAMADMTSMAIAPSVFVYYVYSEVASEISWQIALFVILILFVTCSAIRLSSFHLMKEETFFVGLPASATTLFLLIAAFLKIKFPFILLLIVVLSIATISNIRFPKLGLRVNTIAAILIILTLVVGEIYYNIAPLLLVFTLAIYALVGPFYVRRKF
ncbi:MAG: CDP-alcohol phosphatidyltransferase family protein [Petrotogales bacterium]